ncbi:hypothetical protein [Saccharospirillum salsuginis]|nr:hypothetical protein [Saccharospirillum salsuginis]
MTMILIALMVQGVSAANQWRHSLSEQANGFSIHIHPVDADTLLAKSHHIHDHASIDDTLHLTLHALGAAEASLANGVPSMNAPLVKSTQASTEPCSLTTAPPDRLYRPPKPIVGQHSHRTPIGCPDSM